MKVSLLFVLFALIAVTQLASAQPVHETHIAQDIAVDTTEEQTPPSSGHRRHLLAVYPPTTNDCVGQIISAVEEIISDVTTYVKEANFNIVKFILEKIPQYSERIRDISIMCFKSVE